MFNKIKNIYRKNPGNQKRFKAFFDTLESVSKDDFVCHDQELIHPEDFKKSLSFLKSYTGSVGTFNAYRRELERFLQWSSQVAHKSLKEITRDDIVAFIKFCKNPPKSWIGVNKVPRFIIEDGKRVPNPFWKPFVVTVTKAAHKKGERPHSKDFELSDTAIKDIFAILNSFYNYLVQETYVPINPLSLIRQKSQFIKKHQGQMRIRRLSEVQWNYVIETARQMAEDTPEKHQRTLFILSILYSLYLRISELGANDRWSPQMRHFYKDDEGYWWFTTVGKGNKQRQIAVSDSMLEALKVWRKHLGLSPLPSPSDKSPLLPKTRGTGPIKHITHIRRLVQDCFDQAIENLKRDNLGEEADALMDATVHWLRHTGISDDVKIRPREHVRDDAGHSSSAITDKYIDIERRERHQSARNKGL